MQLGDLHRRGVLLAALAAACAPRSLPGFADDLAGAVSKRAAELYAAGSRLNGRGANAFLRVRATAGVDRTGTVANPLFKSGQIFDELRGASPGRGARVHRLLVPRGLILGVRPQSRRAGRAHIQFVLSDRRPDAG